MPELPPWEPVEKKRERLEGIVLLWSDTKILYDSWDLKRRAADEKCRETHKELDRLQYEISQLTHDIAMKEMEKDG
jgi:hypothetical protein